MYTTRIYSRAAVRREAAVLRGSREVRMKTIIYYFTGTGNSLQISRDLATYLNETDIFPITGYIDIQEIVHKNTRVGIVFPVYCWGLPNIVCEFVAKLRLDEGCPVFSVATCGGNIGGANAQLDELLRSMGMKLSCGFSVNMPGNYIPMYQAPKTEKIKKILAAARAKVREIAKILNRGEERPYEHGSFFWRALGRVSYNSFIGSLEKSAEKFHADEDKCVSCGTCVSVCPARSIKIPKPKTPPEWIGHCEQCMACIQWCPEEAIEYGKRTAGRHRYHYPGIRVEDIIPPAPGKKTPSPDKLAAHEARRAERKGREAKLSRGDMPQKKSAAKKAAPAKKAAKTKKG